MVQDVSLQIEKHIPVHPLLALFPNAKIIYPVHVGLSRPFNAAAMRNTSPNSTLSPCIKYIK